MSRTRISPELAKKVYAICHKMGCDFVEEEYIKDASGEGYKRYFYVFDKCYPYNDEFKDKLYNCFKEEDIDLLI